MNFEQILLDREHGAAALLNAFLDWMERELAAGRKVGSREGHQLVQAHPGMVCFLHLTAWLEKAPRDLMAVRLVRQELAMDLDRVVLAFGSCLRKNPRRIGVLSHSSVVVRCLSSLRQAGVRVLVARGDPVGEGVRMAESLVREGLDVQLLADGAFFSALPAIDAVVLGCDAWSDSYFINRTGSAAVIRLANQSDVPVLVAAGPLKYISDEAIVQLPLKSGPASEIYSGDAPVRVSNNYLERVKRENVTIVGSGVTGTLL